MEFEKYNSGNINEIKNLFTTTFSDSEGESEGLVIGELVYNLMSMTHEKDIYVFVAKDDEKLMGSIIFTRLRFEQDVYAFIMSPVAVLTNNQGKGIGQKLIKFGLRILKQEKVELVLTYGDPNFYSKVGFMPVDEKTIKAPLKLSYPEGWIGQTLTDEEIKPIAGRSFCVEALNNPVYW